MVPPNHNRYPLQKGNKRLYCVMVSELHGQKWVLDKVYTHAADANTAFLNYRASIPRNIKFKIVGIAPVVGLKCDDKGENITV